MANFTEVTGFYVPIGGVDYPGSWSPNTPFGFDPNQVVDPVTGKLVPVYKSSMNDVVNAFKAPITGTMKFAMQGAGVPAGLLSCLVIDKPSPEFDQMQMCSTAPSDIWVSIYKLIEYVYLNQSDITFSSFQSNIVGIIGVNPIPYVANSIMFNKKSNSWRVEYLTFKIDFGSNDIVDFKIYFNPDSLVTDESQNRFQVYMYEDRNGDNLISTEEWNKQIVEKHLEIFNTGRYKAYKSFETRYRWKDNTGAEFYTAHLFIVYTILDNFTTEMVKSKIKEFLQTTIRYGKTVPYTFQECVYHYPDLFSERIVNIYPVNNIDINLKYMVPVTYSMIHDTLVRNNVEPVHANFQNSEILYVGNKTTSGTPNKVPFPVICVDSVATSSLRPIGRTYPDYLPLYKPFPGYITGSNTEVFHNLLCTALEVLVGEIQPSHSSVVSVPEEYGFTVNISNGKVNSVKFSHLSTDFLVNKMLSPTN